MSVRDIFAALQEQEVDRLQQVASAIQTFHANATKASLKHADTRDRSAPRIGRLREVAATALLYSTLPGKVPEITSIQSGVAAELSGGSRISRRRRGLPRWLRFENCVFPNERIWTLGGACAGLGSKIPEICQWNCTQYRRLPWVCCGVVWVGTCKSYPKCNQGMVWHA